QDMRIIVKAQRDLWIEGVRAGEILGSAQVVESSAENEEEETAEEEIDTSQGSVTPGMFSPETQAYRAGKWGRYVRAPDVYFEIMRRFGKRFVALGEIAAVRFGVKTGCDAFFMPRDV